MDLLQEHQSQIMKFVSFKETIIFLATKYPQASNGQLAEILLRKMLRENRRILDVYFLSPANEMIISCLDSIAHKNSTSVNIIENMYECIISGMAYTPEFSQHFYYELAMSKVCIDKYGFSRDDLQIFFNDIGQDIDVYASPPSQSLSQGLPVWENDVKGMDTALKFIAGLCLALEKSGSKYRRGKKINRSAVAKTALDALIEFNPDAQVVTERQLTNLINEALTKFSPQLKDN